MCVLARALPFSHGKPILMYKKVSAQSKSVSN